MSDLTDDEWDEWLSNLQEKYTFYIMNPERKPGAEYTLWIQEEDGREYPIISSNTGGFVTFSSRDNDVGDGIQLTGDFFHALGLTVHETMAFMPPMYDHEQFMDTVENVYGSNPPEHEVWLLDLLRSQFTMGEKLIPELEPLAEWCSEHTEFGIPILNNE